MLASFNYFMYRCTASAFAHPLPHFRTLSKCVCELLRNSWSQSNQGNMKSCHAKNSQPLMHTWICPLSGNLPALQPLGLQYCSSLWSLCPASRWEAVTIWCKVGCECLQYVYILSNIPCSCLPTSTSNLQPANHAAENQVQSRPMQDLSFYLESSWVIAKPDAVFSRPKTFATQRLLNRKKCPRQEMDPSSDRCQELLIKIWLPGHRLYRTNPVMEGLWHPW